jgi:zinc protease
MSDDGVVLLPVHNDPTISLRIWFKVGSQNDPAGKEGLSAITASMLTDASTKNNSYEQILDKLYPLAAGYGASESVEMTVVYGRTHKDNLDKYYPLFTDAILRPAFTQDDLDRIRSKALNHLENNLRYSNDEELGKTILYNDIFAGTPYGHITTGTIEGIKNITTDDVEQFYKKYYRSDNVVIGIGGGFDSTLVTKLQNDLESLPSGTAEKIPPPHIQPTEGFHVTIVEKEANATAISMGFPINILRGTKDWYALAIANSWFGEHRNSSSHLFQVIREQRGLNYGDYSYVENFPSGGHRTQPPQNVSRRQQIFEIWIRPVPNESRIFALRAALREFKYLVENGMTQSQFDLTSKFLKKYVLHYAPTTMERLGYAVDDKFYGINGSHLEMFQKAMTALTVEDVNSSIRKYLQYGKMNIAIVTDNAKQLKRELVGDMPSPITYATQKPDEILNEDKEISTFPIRIKPEDITIVSLADLFMK